MSEIVREMTREELITRNNELRAENERLYEELQEARLAVEHNGNLVEQERLRHELYRKDGEWYVKIKAVKRKIIAWMPLPKPWKG